MKQSNFNIAGHSWKLIGIAVVSKQKKNWSTCFIFIYRRETFLIIFINRRGLKRTLLSCMRFKYKSRQVFLKLTCIAERNKRHQYTYILLRRETNKQKISGTVYEVEIRRRFNNRVPMLVPGNLSIGRKSVAESGNACILISTKDVGTMIG